MVVYSDRVQKQSMFVSALTFPERLFCWQVQYLRCVCVKFGDMIFYFKPCNNHVYIYMLGLGKQSRFDCGFDLDGMRNTSGSRGVKTDTV